jgi:glycosyltransferase involved in cell wall biosynthesis
MSRGGVVCLLPARNAAPDLQPWFASVQRFADSVVALDDGSTDETCEVLRSNSLVKVLLTNPGRRDYRGWDDGANRNRLLEAAAELEPDWIVSLDADERIDAADGKALRAFLDGDAIRGCAYAFQHFRMWGERMYDPAGHWIHRLFSYMPGQAFPDRRFHFDPVPTAIPRERWIPTTIRVQHFAAMTEERMVARAAKYAAADPGGRTDFGGLDEPRPEHLRPWPARPPLLPVLLPVTEG